MRRYPQPMTALPPPPNTPAGWYPDASKRPHYWDGARWDPPAEGAVVAGVTSPGWYPHGVNGQTYWDGQQWTDQHAPLAQRNGSAIASLVLPLVAFAVAFFVGLLAWAVVAILLLAGIAAGIDGLRRAKQIGGEGRSMATVGLFLCLLPIIVLVVSILN